MGDNGAGKSTLDQVLAGAIQPDGGEIEVDGEPVAMTDPQHAPRLGIETVYQDLALAPDLDAAANVFLGREVRSALPRAPQPGARCAGARPRASRSSGSAWCRTCACRSSSFSGGQRQSVAIARAAMWAKHAIIMDEPTAALGVIQTARVLELITRIRERGLAVVFVSHNLPQVLEVADRIEVMRLGARVARFRRDEPSVEQLIGAISGAYSNELPA